MKKSTKKSTPVAKKVNVKKVAVKKESVKKQPSKKVAVKKTLAPVKKTNVDNSFENKSKKVEQHLITKGSITSWDAITLYKATRLSAIIFNLKKKGFIIVTVMEKNNKSNFGRYHYNGMKSK